MDSTIAPRQKLVFGDFYAFDDDRQPQAGHARLGNEIASDSPYDHVFSIGLTHSTGALFGFASATPSESYCRSMIALSISMPRDPRSIAFIPHRALQEPIF